MLLRTILSLKNLLFYWRSWRPDVATAETFEKRLHTAQHSDDADQAASLKLVMTEMFLSTVGLTCLSEGVPTSGIYLTALQKSWISKAEGYGFSVKIR